MTTNRKTLTFILTIYFIDMSDNFGQNNGRHKTEILFQK